MRLNKLFDYLKQNNINVIDDDGNLKKHWIMPESLKYKKKEILKEIFLCLDRQEVRTSYFTIQKNKKIVCPYEFCVNPDCHNIVLNKRNFLKSSLSVEDLMEISEEIDIDLYYKLGHSKFLKNYNDSVPDFLKLNSSDLKLVVKYMENKNND